jgi:hypothetical protein
MKMRQNLHRIGYLLALAATLLLCTTLATVKGQEPAPAGQLLSPDQLDDLVAPIALYPDPLISQILVAVTYPLELVEANQWLQRNPGLSGVALTQAVGVQDWDPSVQALLAFSDVLNYLTEDISWTTTLGDAFLAQEADVMDAIQRMRAKAVRNGKLATSPQQQVTQVYDSGHPVYLIAPVDPEVIYVPVYDPFYIWGAPAYYPYASWYYPVHNSNIYFSRRVSLGLVYGSGWQDSGWAGWNDWGWRPAWGAHTVFVNNTFIAHHSFTSNRQVQTGTAQWRHDAVHRQGVPYSMPALTQRFHSNEQQQISRSGGAPVQQGGGMPVVQRANERTVVRQTSPIVRQDGGQARGGGGVSNGFRGVGQNSANPNPGTAVPTRTAISTQGQQPSRSFETGRRGNVSPSPVAAAPAGPVVSTPVQQPSRSFETGRRGNVSPSPVAAAPAGGQSAPARVNVPQTNSRQTAPTQESSPVSRAQAPSSTQNYGGGGGGGGGRGRR